MAEFTIDTEHPITIPCDAVHLDGILHIPHGAKGIVLFAHGSGSSRLSPRNQFVAHTLQEGQLATLLFDLLIPEEEEVDTTTLQYRFDIDFLASRLLAATDWLMKNPMLQHLAIGYFGASTGGGAALVAAAERPKHIKAVVSRGGRPDLAEEALIHVQAPTLLIVGGNDTQVIELNQQALNRLTCTKQLAIVPGATHLFEEPGKLAEVAELAKEWFGRYLV